MNKSGNGPSGLLEVLRRKFLFSLAGGAALTGSGLPGKSVAWGQVAKPTVADPILRTVHPREIDEPLNNPFMGWGLWAGPRYLDGTLFSLDYNTTGFGDDAPLFGWVLVDWMWSDLEPQEGVYDLKELDAIMNYWAVRGKQIYLRVWVTDDPGWSGKPGNEVCPEWLWKAGARYREYTGEGRSRKREPDYLDPTYQTIYLPKVRRFLSALAERYDKPDSPVVMWGVMGYGQWGEWLSDYPWPGRDVKHNLLAQIVNMYAEIFTVKQPCISYVYDSDLKQVRNLADYMYRQAYDVAVAKGFALARHGFIDGIRLYDGMIMRKYWRQLPFFAEANWPYADMKDERTHGTVAEHVEVFSAWHSNYGHLYLDAANYKRAMREDRVHFENGLRSGGFGYRLVLASASWPEELPAGHLLVLRQTWMNRNSGRLYILHPLRVYLTDREGNERFSQDARGFDETEWVQGETYRVISMIRLPKNLPSDVYDVRIALVDGKGVPCIKLAIDGADTKGRYKLGSIRILPY